MIEVEVGDRGSMIGVEVGDRGSMIEVEVGDRGSMIEVEDCGSMIEVEAFLQNLLRTCTICDVLGQMNSRSNF